MGEGEFGDEDLPGAPEHAFRASGDALVLFLSPDISDDFGDLVDVAANHLGLVVFESARPVAGLFNLPGLEEVVDLVDAGLVNDVPNAQVCCLVDGSLDDEVTAMHPKGRVLGGGAFDAPGGEVRDRDGTVVRIDQRRPPTSQAAVRPRPCLNSSQNRASRARCSSFDPICNTPNHGGVATTS